MEQSYILIDDFIRERTDAISIEIPVGEWEKMSAMLDESHPVKKKTFNYKNIVFWGCGLIVLLLFIYQQIGSEILKNANCVPDKRINIVNERKPSQVFANQSYPVQTVQVNQIESNVPVNVHPKSNIDNTKDKLEESVKEKKNQVIEAKSTLNNSILPEKLIENNNIEKSAKLQYDYFGVPTDSIIYDNIGKRRKKR